MDGGNAKGLSGTILALWAKLPLPAHAPFLRNLLSLNRAYCWWYPHPCGQSFRSCSRPLPASMQAKLPLLLTPLTCIHAGIKKASVNAGFFCPVSASLIACNQISTIQEGTK